MASRSPRARGTRVDGQSVLTLILAGGQGKRMGVLTEDRAKPVMPFGGTYHLIDFALSNCVNSGLSDVWVVEEYELHSLNDHLRNGRPWDLDRTHGGLQVLPPYTGGDEEGGFARGNAHALWLQRQLIEEFDPDVLLVLSADHVYALDYGEVIRAHVARAAQLTMVTVPVPPGERASRFGNVVVGEDGRVRQFAYKPDKPISDTVTTEVFAYDARALLAALQALAEDGGAEALGDFGERLVPHFVEGGGAYAWAFDGYWRDVGLPDAYWRAHMDLLDRQSVVLDRPDWPILTAGIPRTPARIEDGAVVRGSILSYGCEVAGTVERSVLAPGVIVEAGATVRGSVLLRDVTVRAGATVERAIVDNDACIGAGARVGAAQGDLVVVGEGASVADGAVIAAGEQVAPTGT
ncbi:glucose-1-phosphate adenylyltransferase family protein [Deinococcus maricopensis]|uniref:Glucose-1-phosphate adenylyltransferase n=1 Tax=Deinococcus maricopensis (strain DSM 21211 / LMG 22137 / NRRL B-23946 / LB-34) TaxID=709986 RepID=E8U590_DEIML|nr:sugar phosphate nucleotidyltransferase [Deinococcus maricopensis]ADV66229.1 Glucose-1-phosphate adenylyltransferase [Deinococcus maricopensis DSM 21211]